MTVLAPLAGPPEAEEAEGRAHRRAAATKVDFFTMVRGEGLEHATVTTGFHQSAH